MKSKIWLKVQQKPSKWTFSNYSRMVFTVKRKRTTMFGGCFSNPRLHFVLISWGLQNPLNRKQWWTTCVVCQKRKKTLLKWRMPIKEMFDISGKHAFLLQVNKPSINMLTPKVKKTPSTYWAYLYLVCLICAKSEVQKTTICGFKRLMCGTISWPSPLTSWSFG